MARIGIKLVKGRGRHKIRFESNFGGCQVGISDIPFLVTKQGLIQKEFRKLSRLSEKNRYARKNKLPASDRTGQRFEKKLKNLGYLLFRTLFPRERMPRLDEHFGEGDNLELLLDDYTRIYPWELLWERNDFLCLKYSVGRIVESDEEKLAYYGEKDSHQSPQVLIVGLDYKECRKDLEKLDYPIKEALTVAKTLRNAGFKVRPPLLEEDATSKKVKRELAKGPLVFHFTGHGDFRERGSRGESGIICLCDGDLTTEEIETSIENKGAPYFSFVNACNSGREKYSSEIWEPHKGMAGAFIRYGAVAFAGTFWSVDDEISKDVSTYFYRKMIQGMSIGQALTKAKLRSQSRRPDASIDTWPAYVYYGKPELRLPPFQ